MRDHPRVCGYYLKKYGLSLTLRGSPPRVRVLRHRSFSHRKWRGITPACAGTTPPSFSNDFFHRDHPRVCGYYSKTCAYEKRTSGSPPRVRVLQPAKTDTLKVCGITPACAGTTKNDQSKHKSNQDHPRVCGYYPIFIVKDG